MNTPKLPPLPDHPEPRVMTWSDLEERAIREYGAACAIAAIEAQGVPDGVVLQIDAAVTQAQKVLSDWNEWYGMHGEKAPLPPGGIVKAQELLAVAKSLLASAPPAPQSEELVLWKARALQAEAIVAKFMAPQAAVVQQEPVLTTCNCRWDGEKQVQQCTLHEAHIDAIHEWAERAKTAEAKLSAQQAKPQPLSDEQISHEALHVQKFGHLGWEGFHAGVRFAEAYYSIKE